MQQSYYETLFSLSIIHIFMRSLIASLSICCIYQYTWNIGFVWVISWSNYDISSKARFHFVCKILKKPILINISIFKYWKDFMCVCKLPKSEYFATVTYPPTLISSTSPSSPIISRFGWKSPLPLSTSITTISTSMTKGYLV